MTQTTWIIAEIFAGLAILILLSALASRWFSPPVRRGPAEILKERYARGELSNNEYRQMAENLGITIPPVSDRPATPAHRMMEPMSASERAREP